MSGIHGKPGVVVAVDVDLAAYPFVEACPFCGQVQDLQFLDGVAVIDVDGSEAAAGQIVCGGCGAGGPIAEGGLEQALLAWQDSAAPRPDSAAPRQRVLQ